MTLNRFLDGIPNRRKWIRNLILHYDPAIHGHACSRAFNLVQETKLRNLHLFLDEEKLIKRHSLTRISDPIARLPGMKELGEVRSLSHVAMHGPCTRTTKHLAKLTEYKRNDGKDEDELVGLQRRKEREKYLARLKRLWRDGKNAREQQAAMARREKLALEKAEARVRKEEEWRRTKAEGRERDKMEKEKRGRGEMEGASTSLKGDNVGKGKRKKTTLILKTKEIRDSTPVEESEEEDNEQAISHYSDEEPSPPPPPPKRRKTIPAANITSKRAPKAKVTRPAPPRTKRKSEMASIFELTPEDRKIMGLESE
jgi:hypothetical protein